MTVLLSSPRAAIASTSAWNASSTDSSIARSFRSASM